METTATYDKETKEFIVNTPNPLAQKYWITNGACHAHHIIVFSQLYIDGVNQGTVEPLLWDTSFKGAPPLRQQNVLSQQNPLIIIVFITSIKGRHTF